MGANSHIEWTDKTWNPIAGCTPVSSGCLSCYAATMAHRLEGMGQAEKYGGLTVLNPKGERHFNGVVKCHDDVLAIPLKWKKPRRIFVNSMSDTFHKEVPFHFIDKMFAVMALCPQHTFQVLTKRPERMAEYLNQKSQPRMLNDTRHNVGRAMAYLNGAVIPSQLSAENFGLKWPLPNVWVGTSVENQAAADERIPHLLRCPAAVRFLSCEPLLGPVDLSAWLGTYTCYTCCYRGFDSAPDRHFDEDACPDCGTVRGDGFGDAENDPACRDEAKLGWVIVGGESGPGARPCESEWVRGIVQQCTTAGVPVFVKQMGARLRMNFKEWNEGWMSLTDKHDFRLDFPDAPRGTWRGFDSKGGDWEEWPEDLRVRDFPSTPLTKTPPGVPAGNG